MTFRGPDFPGKAHVLYDVPWYSVLPRARFTPGTPFNSRLIGCYITSQAHNVVHVVYAENNVIVCRT